MLTLTETQKDRLLKYVDDKTYTNRLIFVIGAVVTITSIVGFLDFSNAELNANVAYTAFLGGVAVATTLKDVIRFRNVKNHLNDGTFIATRKPVLKDYTTETTQTADYSKSLQNSHLYSNNEPPRNSKITIRKYYIVDSYNVKYECIKYLDYRKCLDTGEFISVDFPTGERFALYE